MKIKFKNILVGADKRLHLKKEIAEREFTESEISAAFGYTLKKLREHKGLSLNALSKEVDIPNPTINRYENGINIPTITQAVKLADYFDLSIELFIAMGLAAIYEDMDIIEQVEKLERAMILARAKKR